MALPMNVLQSRLINELAMCRNNLEYIIECTDEQFSEFPVTLDVAMRDVPGPIFVKGQIDDSTEHQLRIVITKDYPYEKPIVRWQSIIFHPNIMLPRDGGYVCTKLLDSWNFSSNLLGFIKGVESLLANPNPMSPYDTESCMMASEKFINNPYSPIVQPTKKHRGPKIVS